MPTIEKQRVFEILNLGSSTMIRTIKQEQFIKYQE